MWVIGGGVLAAYLFWGESKQITSGQGALVGFFAGLWGALVSAVLGGILWSFLSDTYMSKMYQALSEQDIPAESMEFLTSIFSGNPLLIAGVYLISSLVANSIFATLGGLICAAILKKKNKVEHTGENPIEKAPDDIV